jgi:hypothetical protein
LTELGTNYEDYLLTIILVIVGINPYYGAEAQQEALSEGRKPAMEVTVASETPVRRRRRNRLRGAKLNLITHEPQPI